MSKSRYRLNGQYEIMPEQMQIEDYEVQISDLIETDQIIYEYIVENGFITTKQVTDITRIGTTAGPAIALNRLIDRKLVKKERKGRQFIYVYA